MIPAKAVEAAEHAAGCVLGSPVSAKDMEGIIKILEAAAPHMLIEAFNQGQKSGMRHADRLVAAAKIGMPELAGQISPNPYRPTR